MYQALFLLPLESLRTRLSSFGINTRREGLEDCLYRFGSRLCNIYVTSRVGSAHMMPRASQLIFIWPFTRVMDILYNRISLCKISRTTKLVKQSRSGRSNVHTRDVTRVLQSDWPAKILAHGSKTVLRYRQSPRPSLRVFILRELNAVEGDVWFRDYIYMSIAYSFLT